MSWLKRYDPQRLREVVRTASEDKASTMTPTEAPPMKPQQLGPNQLKWLEERFRFYGIHRKQAEAPTGVAVVQSEAVQVAPWQTQGSAS